MIKQKELLPNKRFKEFDEVWKERKLEDVIEGLYNGQTPSRFNDRYWNGDINWLSSGELNKSVVTHTIEKITEEGRKAANLKIVPKNTFVMAITGLEAAGTRGNCAVTGIDTTLNQSCMAIYPNRNLLDSHFLFQWYRKVGETYGLKYTQGTKQQSYNAALVNKLKIILPSKIEQQKIGQFFKHLDEMIALQQRKIDKTKALKSAYLVEMFPAEGERVPKRRFAGFTDEWKERKLSDLGDFKSNGVNKKVSQDEKPIALLNYMDVYSRKEINKSNLNELMQVTAKESQILENNIKKNDVFFTPTSETADDIGRVMVIEEDLPGTVYSYHLMRFRPDMNTIYSIFPNYAFATKSVRNQMRVLAQGVQRFVLNREAFELINILLPSIAEQEKIGEFFKNLDEMIATHQQKLEKLKATKQAYLHEMFV